MDTTYGNPRVRLAALVAGCLVAVASIGYVDGITTAYVAFSIFYMPPIIAATWYGGRAAGFVVAVTAAVAGLIADAYSVHVAGAAAFRFVNVGLRLALFTATVFVVARLKEGVQRERELTEQARESAARLAAANQIKDELMRTVVQDVRAPLSDIYASARTLQLARANGMSADDAGELVAQIADASMLLSELVRQLIDAERVDTAALEAAG